jgi:putative Mg2+ transporter-C (MgtC) family protein
VSLGAALMTVTSVQLALAGGPMDPSVVTRTVQGIVTGIGFLGGGVILRVPHGDGETVRGLTTAATIWVAAALGIACGAGHWATAVLSLGASLVVLVVGRWVERRIHRAAHMHEHRDGTPGPTEAAG